MYKAQCGQLESALTTNFQTYLNDGISVHLYEILLSYQSHIILNY